MQSVNVTFSTNLNKGNDNCLLIECNTAVTVPNTKPQRNTDGETAANNNSFKLVRKNHGALNRFSIEPPSQCRSNQIPGYDIPECDHQNDPNKSEYLKELTYNDKCSMTTGSDEGYISLNRLIALCKNTKLLMDQGKVPPRLLGLYGGGESSLSTGTTGWGTPPGTNTNNNNGWGNTTNQANANNSQWNNNPNRTNANNQGPQNVQDNSKPNNQNANLPPQNAQMPQTSQANSQSWGPQNKSSQGTAGPNNGPAPPVSGAPAGPNIQAPPANSTKQQLEQLNNMREALFAQDGWGGVSINIFY